MAIHLPQRDRPRAILAAMVLGTLLLTVVPSFGAIPLAGIAASTDARDIAAPTGAFFVPSEGPNRPDLFPPPFYSFPSVSSGSNTYFVGAQVPTSLCGTTCSYVTNTGVQTMIQVVSQPVVGCLSYWVSDDSAANIWGQVGYYICNSSTPIAFYQIWNLNTGSAITTGTTSVSTGYHTFSMYSQSGGNVWAYALDGVVFGTYDMGSSISMGTYPVQAVSEEGYVSGPWSPAQVAFSPAIQTFQTATTYPVGNGWYSPSTAFEPWGGCTSSGAPNNTAGYTCWGIAGNLQDSSIPGDALVTGGSTALLQGGTYLWNSVSAEFALAASPSSVAVNAGVSGTSTITVSSIGGFTGTVVLAASASPATGLSCTLTPTSLSGGSGSSTLSCSGSSGTYTVTVTGTSGSLTHLTSVTFTVSDFTLTASPAAVTINVGATGTSTITVGSVNGFGNTVSLASTVSPATGLTCSLSPTSVTGSGTATLSCTGSAGGSYTVTVTGTSGSLTHSVTVTFSVSSGIVLTLSYTLVGGGAGYTAPTLTYVQGGSAKTATLITSATAYTVDANSAWSVTNPVSGSSLSERWQTNQATSGTATTSVTIVFSYYHQYAVAFAYSAVGGGSGYSAPTVAYTAFGGTASTAIGLSVWADAATSYAYPVALPGSSSSEAWRTNSPTGTIAGAATVTDTYYHQFSVTFSYTVLGGGSGYTAPTVATTQFGAGASVATGAATWIDAGASYSFTNPLSGSGTTQRWISPSAGGTLTAAGTLTASYYHQFLVNFSFTVVGGGSGFSAPAVSYVSLGLSPSTVTGASVWADAGSAYQFQNPLTGSSTTESWRTNGAGGAVTQAGSYAATYYHQFLVTFAYQVLGGGTGYSAPTVSYTSLGSSASTATGATVWADAGTSFRYPVSLPGSTASEAWRTNAGTGTVGASGSITVSYYHQFAATFTYTVLGGGSGYAAPSVATAQFGSSISAAVGASTWVDAGTAYTFANPLGGSTASERWIAASPGGSVTLSATYAATYVHQFAVSFAYAVLGGGSGYSAPTALYTAMGSTLSTAMGATVWVDAGTAYAFTNPLSGSSSTAAWRTNAANGDVSAAGTASATYYYQFLVVFSVQAVNGNPPPVMPNLTATVFAATASFAAGGWSWVDANGAYSYPASFAGATGERWMSASPASGTVALAGPITASYYHQFNAAFAYAVSGGGGGYSAPSLTYVALGTGLTTTAAASVWADAGSAFVYAASLPGGSSTQRWLTPAPGGTITGSGNFTVTYIHQFWIDFTYTVKGGGSGYSAPNVTYSNLSAPRSVLAVTLWVWADAGTVYQYQNPLPGSTSTNSWQTNNGVGTTGSSTTYSATYRHQYKVKIKTTSTAGVLTQESPLVNVTLFGSTVSMPADNVTWVDAGGSYSFPGVFYGPVPGERWITATPPSGLVLAPMNITAAYAHQYYLAIQVNASAGGTVSGTAGWYNATATLTLEATANPGWQFQGWIGSGNGSYSGSSTTASVAMDDPVTETAVFYVGLTLTASDGGSLQYAYGGTTGWVPAGGAETLYLAPGTNVTLSAAPSLFYQFDGWGGSAAGSASTVVLVANVPQTLSATFGWSLYSKADSLLGLALAGTAIVVLVLALRRRSRKKEERALRAARLRARAQIQTYR